MVGLSNPGPPHLRPGYDMFEIGLEDVDCGRAGKGGKSSIPSWQVPCICWLSEAEDIFEHWGSDAGSYGSSFLV